MATVLASNNNNSLNFSGSLISFSGIYMLFLRFKRKCIYIIAFLGTNMDKETIERIENMIRQAIKDMFDENYCPHGTECRFCREDLG